MATLSELKSMQAEAGAAFVAASEAYRAAWSELHALDKAISNGNVGGGEQPTFNTIPHLLTHPIFYPDRDDRMTAPDVQRRLEQLLRQFTPS